MSSMYGNMFESYYLIEAIDKMTDEVVSIISQCQWHLIKWYCDPQKQSVSWARSALQYSSDVMTKLKNTNIRRGLLNMEDEVLKKAIHNVKKDYTNEGITPPVFPEKVDDLLPDVRLERIIDVNNVYNFLIEYAQPHLTDKEIRTINNLYNSFRS